MELGSNLAQKVSHQILHGNRSAVASSLKKRINLPISPRIVASIEGLGSPTLGSPKQASASTEISDLLVLRRTVPSRMRHTGKIRGTPVMTQNRSPVLARGAMQRRRRIVVRLRCPRSDRDPDAKAATSIGAGFGRSLDLHRTSITACGVSRSGADLVNPGGARFRRWGKNVRVPRRWDRVRRSEADRKCGISTARAG